ncbi:MAG: hypothetical protein AAFX78_06870 [Cyanobacteria bacterium J06638_20]
MTLFKQILLPATVLAGAVFGATVLPLVAIPEKAIAVELQGQPVFRGSLEELATPYLGFAAGFSAVVGLTSAAFLGWRVSTRKAARTEAQLAQMQQTLQQRELQIEALSVSQNRLQAAALDQFLDDAPEAQPRVLAESFQVVNMTAVKDSQSFTVLDSKEPQGTMQESRPSIKASSQQTPQTAEKAKVALPGAQSYGAYIRQESRSANDAVPVQTPGGNDEAKAGELLQQLKTLMVELEKAQVPQKAVSLPRQAA